MAAESKSSGGKALGPEELTEIKRVWAVVDTDGSGTIDGSELRGLMRALDAGRDPSESEVRQVMEMVDDNKDGIISWEEFKDAMTRWLGGSRKREIDDAPGSPSARKRIHRDISSFFTQFRRRDNFDEIRAKIRAELDDESGDLYSADPIERQRQKEVDADTKAELLKKCASALPLVPNMLPVLNSGDPTKILEQLSILTNLLSLPQEFGSAALRDEIAPILFNIWHTVTEWNLPVCLCQFLAVGFGLGADTVAQRLARNEMVRDAMDVLYLYTRGPQVPHVREANKRWQEENIWITTKKPLIEHHVVSNLKTHLQNNADQEIRCSAARLLASIASSHLHPWTFVNAQDVMAVCIARVQARGESAVVLNAVTLLISVLVGDTHEFELTSDQFTYLKGMQVLQLCAYLLQQPGLREGVDGPGIITNVCAALGQLLPFIQTDLSVVKMVADVPTIKEFWAGDADHKYMAQSAMQASFACLLQLIKYNADAAMWLVTNTGVLDVIQTFFTKVEHQGLRLSAAKLLSALVQREVHKRIVEKRGMIAALITLLQSDDVLQTRVAQLMDLLSRQGPTHVGVLVTHGVAPALLRCLGRFRSHDAMLAEVYQFAGATYNFSLVQHSLAALANILEVGRTNKTAGAPNPFLSHFGMEAVAAIRGLLVVLAEERGSLTFSSSAATDESGDLPQRVTALMTAIRAEHDEATKLGNAVSATVLRTIDQIGVMWKSATAKWAVLESGGMASGVGTSGDVGMNGADAGNMFDVAYHNFASGSGFIKVKARYRPTSVHTAARAGIGAGAGAGAGAGFGLAAGAASMAGDIEVEFTVRNNVSWEHLRAECMRQFGQVVHMQVERDDRSLITIKSQRALTDAIAEVERSPGKCLRLYVIDDYAAGAVRPPPMDERGLPPKKVAIQRLEAQGLRMSTKEIANMYDFFSKMVGRDRGMTRAQFGNNMQKMGVTDPARVNALFNVFDIDGDGEVSFTECVTRLALFQRGSFEERMEAVFQAYDVNNDGELEPAEIFHFMKASTGYSDPVCWQQVEAMLAAGDMTGNKRLSIREFVTAVRKNEALYTMYWIPSGGAGTNANRYENDYYR